MDLVDVAANYGWAGLLVLVVLGAASWAVVHRTAAPGMEVRLLWGLAAYDKKDEPVSALPTASRFKPIPIRDEVMDTIWRVMRPPEEWIERDLSRFVSDHVDELLSGPYHAPCMVDLSTFDLKGTHGTYRVLRKCPQCEKIVLPKGLEDGRSSLRHGILGMIQQAHFKGHKVEPGLVIPVD
jgi:hypothetical protein